MKRIDVFGLFFSWVLLVTPPAMAETQRPTLPAQKPQASQAQRPAHADEDLFLLNQLTLEKYRLVVFADLVSEELRDVGGITDWMQERFSWLRGASVFMGAAGIITSGLGAQLIEQSLDHPRSSQNGANPFRVIALNTKPMFGFVLLSGASLMYSYSSSFASSGVRDVIQFESNVVKLPLVDQVLGYRAHIENPVQESVRYHAHILGLNAQETSRLNESLADAAVAASLDLDPKVTGPVWVDVLDVIQKTRNPDGSPLVSTRVLESAFRLRKDLESLQARAQAQIEMIQRNEEFQGVDVAHVIEQDRKLLSDWVSYIRRISAENGPQLSDESQKKLDETVASANRLLNLLEMRGK